MNADSIGFLVVAACIHPAGAAERRGTVTSQVVFVLARLIVEKAVLCVVDCVAHRKSHVVEVVAGNVADRVACSVEVAGTCHDLIDVGRTGHIGDGVVECAAGVALADIDASGIPAIGGAATNEADATIYDLIGGGLKVSMRVGV